MAFRRFHAVVRGVMMMSVCHVGMMRSFFVVAVGMMLGRFPMMLGRVFVVLRCLLVMFRRFLRHVAISQCGDVQRHEMGTAPRAIPVAYAIPTTRSGHD